MWWRHFINTHHLMTSLVGRFDHAPACDHMAAITGLASCTRLKLVASSSLDGTVRIWDSINKLLRYVLTEQWFPLCFPYQYSCRVWARELCRISPPRCLAECRMRRLNHASFVLLCFALFAFSGLSLVFVESVLHLSSVLYFPAWTDVNGIV